LPRAISPAEDLSRLKVMVVDDHSTTVRLIGDVLRAGGVGTVIAASDGLHAREVMRRTYPDILFVDARMPNMDGLELTRSIRRAAIAPDPKVPNPEVPIIMVTGDRSEHDVEIARRAGVNEFVIKPFTPAALLSRIHLVLKRPRPFVVSERYIGPDRRRRAELSYSGPMRRLNDPEEVADQVERRATRETISIELEAMRGLIVARGGVDRATLQMTYRVMQHTRFRAKQVRDDMIARASDSLLTYVDRVGGPDACDADILEAHFDAIGRILEISEIDIAASEEVVDSLENMVRLKTIGRYAAA